MPRRGVLYVGTRAGLGQMRLFPDGVPGPVRGGCGRRAGRTGPETEQAVIGAIHAACSGQTERTTELIVEQLGSSPPLRVTMAEKIAKLRAWAADRCVPAG